MPCSHKSQERTAPVIKEHNNSVTIVQRASSMVTLTVIKQQVTNLAHRYLQHKPGAVLGHLCTAVSCLKLLVASAARSEMLPTLLQGSLMLACNAVLPYMGLVQRSGHAAMHRTTAAQVTAQDHLASSDGMDAPHAVGTGMCTAAILALLDVACTLACPLLLMHSKACVKLLVTAQGRLASMVSASSDKLGCHLRPQGQGAVYEQCSASPPPRRCTTEHRQQAKCQALPTEACDRVSHSLVILGAVLAASYRALQHDWISMLQGSIPGTVKQMTTMVETFFSSRSQLNLVAVWQHSVQHMLPPSAVMALWLPRLVYLTSAAAVCTAYVHCQGFPGFGSRNLTHRTSTFARLVSAALLPSVMIVSGDKAGLTALLATLQCAAL